jgi:hypothetical protein
MSDAYVETAVQGELERLRLAHPGIRNATLFRVASRLYQFVEAGLLAEDQANADLVTAARAIGLRTPEVQATLRSAHRLALGKPLNLPSSNPRYRSKGPPPIVLTPPDEANPPTPTWRAYAEGFCVFAQRLLWQRESRPALEWLLRRGLRYDTILRAKLGYNPEGFYDDRTAWGLPPEHERGRPRQLWVPSGIVIPWCVDGQIWRVFLRRQLSARQVKQGASKYIQLPGGTNALYSADTLRPGQPAMLVEGAFDALAVQQEAGDLITAVASGTTGARRLRWIAALSLCCPVLLSFDADAGGQEACAYWQSLLGEVARPWWPTKDDPAAMVAAGQDLRGWVKAGLAAMDTEIKK